MYVRMYMCVCVCVCVMYVYITFSKTFKNEGRNDMGLQLALLFLSLFLCSGFISEYFKCDGRNPVVHILLQI